MRSPCLCLLLSAFGLLGGDGPAWVKGPQGRLRIEAAGPAGGATPLLLVHGNGGSRRQWAAQMAHFSKSRRVVCYDLRGMGESDPPRNGDHSLGAMADDLRAVADAEKLGRFVLVGHSYGGAVVGAFAGAYPERVAALVFDDVAGDMRGVPPREVEATHRALQPDRYQQTVRAWFEQILAKALPATRKAVLEDLERTSRDAFAGAYQGLLRHDPAAAVAKYPGPRLHIFTDLLAGNPLAIHAGIPGIEALHLPGTSHWPHMDRATDFNAALEPVLARAELDPAARQFDFWIGEWDVLSPKGEPIGGSAITREIGGRVLVERHHGRRGYEASGFITYDSAARSWRRTWVDSDGLELRLAGGLAGGQMVLEGARSGSGYEILDRIRWEPRKDGTVRKLWETSQDRGRTWTAAFEGIYRRRVETR